ncbi:unnamed protein product [marine sediment metagenome]|uniref:Uncharacterized protein n=1 Tax=marine sediment metagenome TaxID=412755 RepID=X0W284_9ZZZZ
MNAETVKYLNRASRDLGPWLAQDNPNDVLGDIRRLDPEATVTRGDVAEYLATHGYTV